MRRLRGILPTVNGYGDKDPEDAYDAGDPVPVRLEILERIVTALESDPMDRRVDVRRRDALRLVANLEADAAKDRLRLAFIRDALEAF